MIYAITTSRCVSKAMASVALVTSVGFGSVTPAKAEDSGLWDFFRGFSRNFQHVAPAPWVPRYEYYRPRPRRPAAARPKPPSKPEVARVAPENAKPPDPDKRENPLVTLLRDPTLRSGDIVVFPDGPRVFKGSPGTKHALRDFVKVSASSDLSKSTRKTLASIHVGENNAWSSNLSATTEKVAQGDAEVEATGSLPRRGRSRR